MTIVSKNPLAIPLRKDSNPVYEEAAPAYPDCRPVGGHGNRFVAPRRMR